MCLIHICNKNIPYQALRERIRKNETIIDKREWESRIRKGKFKTDKMVGFGD